jgi:hypothetical protein
MNEFFHDLAMFVLGWIWGWFCIVSAPLFRKIWAELKALPSDWKGKPHD